MKILVIEDSARNIASAKLTLAAHDLTIVTNTSEAVEALRYNEERPDAVLTDLYLPRSTTDSTLEPSGLCLALHAVKRSIPVVICTDANHHQDPIVETLSRCLYQLHSYNEKLKNECANTKIGFIDARCVHLKKKSWNGSELVDYDGPDETDSGCNISVLIKNWGLILERMTNDFQKYF